MSAGKSLPSVPSAKPKHLLDFHSSKSEEVTDVYLTDLAAKHGARLGTFDRTIAHATVDVIA